MNKNQAKEILPIIQAFIDGKQVQHLYNKWEDIENLTSDLIINPELYRIKPEPKCRPFKNQEECWNEMLKHQPFGWIRSIATQCLLNIDYIGRHTYGIWVNNSIRYFDAAFNEYNFVDGTPFGMKKE